MNAEDPGQGPIPQPGLFTSLRNLATTLVAVAQTRLELLSAEIEEEQVRLLQILLGSLIALFFSALGVVMLTLFVVAWFWESHRALVIILLAMLYLGIGGVLWLIVRSKVRQKSKLFSASTAELAKDRQQLTPPDVQRRPD